MKPRTGLCTNTSACARAARGEPITPAGPFVCPDCGTPLRELAQGDQRVARSSAGFLVAALVIFGIGILIAWALSVVRPSDKTKTASPAPRDTAAEVAKPTPTPSLATPIPVRRAEPSRPADAGVPNPAPPAGAIPVASAIPVATTTPAAASEPLRMDLAEAENSQVRREVLQRIDLMPNLTPEEKDKLYVQVDRARRMGRLAALPFASGASRPSPDEWARIEAALGSAEVRALLQDPTVVVVLLGYADQAGQPEANLRISLDRAEHVRTLLRERGRVQNVMHSVGMGGSSFFGGKERNRVVEIWAVVP